MPREYKNENEKNKQYWIAIDFLEWNMKLIHISIEDDDSIQQMPRNHFKKDNKLVIISIAILAQGYFWLLLDAKAEGIDLLCVYDRSMDAPFQ